MAQHFFRIGTNNMIDFKVSDVYSKYVRMDLLG